MTSKDYELMAEFFVSMFRHNIHYNLMLSLFCEFMTANTKNFRTFYFIEYVKKLEKEYENV